MTRLRALLLVAVLVATPLTLSSCSLPSGCLVVWDPARHEPIPGDWTYGSLGPPDVNPLDIYFWLDTQLRITVGYSRHRSGVRIYDTRLCAETNGGQHSDAPLMPNFVDPVR